MKSPERYTKKWNRFLAAIVISSSLLAGCSSSEPEVEETPKVTETQKADKVEESEIKEKAPESSEEESAVTEEEETAAEEETSVDEVIEANQVHLALADIPEYSGSPYVVINDNEPYFSDVALSMLSFESYSDLDSKGRAGQAVASISTDLMPTEDRGDISSVKPTGWIQNSYDFVDGEYLYNRCHLIGYQLTAENDNEKNLITGTRYLNVEGMLPFENMVADYIKETNNHVQYRVTPLYDDNNLLASGVLMEAKSVEDYGDGILFCVYCYNVQPGVTIDYATGNNYADGTVTASTDTTESYDVTEDTATVTYVANRNTKKFHRPTCSSVSDIKEKNRWDYTGSREELINMGYDPCKRCNP